MRASDKLGTNGRTNEDTLAFLELLSEPKSSYSSLRHAKDFTDVIIMGDDFKKINAHRIVLATCSKYFEQILQEFKQNCNSPIIVLEGLLATNLESILDYIYKGEVQILQQDLDSFLKIAKRLQLNRLDESRFTGHS